MTAPPALTQLASRAVFTEGLAGIYYRSKYGHDIENWALFEPFQIDAKNPEPIRADDPDFERALQLQSEVQKVTTIKNRALHPPVNPEV
jgi:hypothetical protein